VIIPLWLVCLLANQHETFRWKDTFSVFSVLQGSAEALIRWGGKIYHLLIACFLSNISAKYYENPTMLSWVIARNIGDVFLRHSVHSATSTFHATLIIRSLYRLELFLNFCSSYCTFSCLSARIFHMHILLFIWHIIFIFIFTVIFYHYVICQIYYIYIYILYNCLSVTV